ncbi:soluble N-ethylmaleimide-sensitive factor attachment protein receptor [Ephemerocybe angulata]|uniref:Soluble N-ethylmaleimide-sensitive factor attachment protein receptor n=1 Tax=Ephemerocybe angulata TaxID=980116 RepID=A0A8H6HU33_9AGAR|nr:soluble N-ethylmaleimide-sensitive factor attachment protein receptor [Tulosesus angulatus]
MSLAKLTSISTKTLSLLLERQRMQTLPSFNQPGNPLESSPNTSANSLHLAQIKKNLAQLRAGIKEMEEKGSGGEAAGLLRNQYERMRGMLGDEASDVPSIEETPDRAFTLSPSPSSISASSYATAATGASSSTVTPRASSPLPMPSLGLSASRTGRQDQAAAARFLNNSTSSPAPTHARRESDGVFAPYRDDPAAAAASSSVPSPPEEDAGVLLQTQRFMMEEQDQRLDELSHSINRQHHISVQIGDELEVHEGLLEELDGGVDRTSGRLGSAKRKLDGVAKGIKENSSVFAIGVLIFVLLVLIIVLKT